MTEFQIMRIKGNKAQFCHIAPRDLCKLDRKLHQQYSYYTER